MRIVHPLLGGVKTPVQHTTCGPPLIGWCKDTQRELLEVHPLLGGMKKPDVASYSQSTPWPIRHAEVPRPPFFFPLVLESPALNGLFLGQYNAQNGSTCPLYPIRRKRFLSFKLYLPVTRDGR